MSTYVFGAGRLVLIPIVSSGVATPVRFSALQEFSVDFKFDEKDLHGQNQFALDTARSKGTVELKFKDATVRGALFNSVFFGDTPTTGQTIFQDNETSAVPSASPYTITAAKASAFGMDCGVIFSSSGSPLTCVESAPAAGEYAVSAAGVYTFSEDDTGKSVSLSYTYSTTGSGNQTVITNKLMGVSPKFRAIYSNVDRDDGDIFMQFNVCRSSDLKMAAKNEDYTIPEFTAKATVDASGNLGIFSFPE